MFKKISSVTSIKTINDQKQFVIVDNDGNTVSFKYDPENFVYFRCRAITADEPNGNGDYFPEEEIIKSYKTFIGVGLYKDHDADSVTKAIGKVLWAEYIPEGKYVEVIACIDKKLAPQIADAVKRGIIDSVSMGCNVREVECSICHNIAHSPSELCVHMRPGGVKGTYYNGQLAYEINRGIVFTELSLVSNPADRTARIFEIQASKRKVDEKIKSKLNRYSVIMNSFKNNDFLISPYFNKFISTEEESKEKQEGLKPLFEETTQKESTPELSSSEIEILERAKKDGYAIKPNEVRGVLDLNKAVRYYLLINNPYIEFLLEQLKEKINQLSLVAKKVDKNEILSSISTANKSFLKSWFQKIHQNLTENEIEQMVNVVIEAKKAYLLVKGVIELINKLKTQYPKFYDYFTFWCAKNDLIKEFTRFDLPSIFDRDKTYFIPLNQKEYEVTFDELIASKNFLKYASPFPIHPIAPNHLYPGLIGYFHELNVERPTKIQTKYVKNKKPITIPSNNKLIIKLLLNASRGFYDFLLSKNLEDDKKLRDLAITRWGTKDAADEILKMRDNVLKSEGLTLNSPKEKINALKSKLFNQGINRLYHSIAAWEALSKRNNYLNEDVIENLQNKLEKYLFYLEESRKSNYVASKPFREFIKKFEYFKQMSSNLIIRRFMNYDIFFEYLENNYFGFKMQKINDILKKYNFKISSLPHYDLISNTKDFLSKFFRLEKKRIKPQATTVSAEEVFKLLEKKSKDLEKTIEESSLLSVLILLQTEIENFLEKQQALIVFLNDSINKYLKYENDSEKQSNIFQKVWEQKESYLKSKETIDNKINSVKLKEEYGLNDKINEYQKKHDVILKLFKKFENIVEEKSPQSNIDYKATKEEKSKFKLILKNVLNKNLDEIIEMDDAQFQEFFNSLSDFFTLENGIIVPKESFEKSLDGVELTKVKNILYFGSLLRKNKKNLEDFINFVNEHGFKDIEMLYRKYEEILPYVSIPKEFYSVFKSLPKSIKEAYSKFKFIIDKIKEYNKEKIVKQINAIQDKINKIFQKIKERENFILEELEKELKNHGQSERYQQLQEELKVVKMDKEKLEKINSKLKDLTPFVLGEEIKSEQGEKNIYISPSDSLTETDRQELLEIERALNDLKKYSYLRNIRYEYEPGFGFKTSFIKVFAEDKMLTKISTNILPVKVKAKILDSKTYLTPDSLIEKLSRNVSGLIKQLSSLKKYYI